MITPPPRPKFVAVATKDPICSFSTGGGSTIEGDIGCGYSATKKYILDQLRRGLCVVHGQLRLRNAGCNDRKKYCSGSKIHAGEIERPFGGPEQ
jgi:hypothetical protein